MRGTAWMTEIGFLRLGTIDTWGPDYSLFCGAALCIVGSFAEFLALSLDVSSPALHLPAVQPKIFPDTAECPIWGKVTLV